MLNTGEEAKMCCNLDEASKSERQTYEERMRWAREHNTRRGDLEQDLAEVKKRAVEVWMVPPEALFGPTPTSGPAQRNAMIMMYKRRYVVFLSPRLVRDGWWPSSLNGLWAEKFVVFHEYHHALSGEVFADAPQVRFNLLMRAKRGEAEAAAILGEQEFRANDYAAHIVRDKAREDGNALLADDLERKIDELRLPQT
ncbi:MAG: hypothetical protein NT049_17280 [Planctomycetota bacterium]|nr:hypothetical protein [Planctomycetota bacterium]